MSEVEEFNPRLMSLMKGDDESYKHAAARTVVAHWINEIEATRDGTTVVFDLVREDGRKPYSSREVYWRRNRGALVEVPVAIYDVIQGHETTYAWDEGCGPRWPSLEYGRVPTYKQCIDLGIEIAMIFDVAVYHKGTIAFAIEVRHRHAVDERKGAMIEAFGAPVFEMEAEWILRQVRRPDRLQAVMSWN